MRQLLIDKPEGLGVYPFISLEEMTKQILIKSEAPKEANVGDILLYNKNTSKMKLVKSDESLDAYDSAIYSPIGVVMIPSNHDLYGTGEFTVISLDYMDYNNPDTGNKMPISMHWGGNGYDIPELPNFRGYGVVPSTNFTGTLSNDRLAKYNYSYNHLPSPYNADGTRNSNYFNTNCLSDINGKFNTDKIMLHVTASWQSGSITNSKDTGNYPAACCCRRYSVLGTNQGDWYLGAAGEMGYMIARLKEIQDSITKIKTKFSKGVEFNDKDFNFWCSTDHSANNVYGFDITIGMIAEGGKTVTNYLHVYTRALLRVSQSQL